MDVLAITTLSTLFNLTLDREGLITENTTSSSHRVQLLVYKMMIPGLAGLAIVLNLIVIISSGLILKRGTT